MDNLNKELTSQADENLIAFISNFADSGKSMYHLAAKLGQATASHLIFL